MKRRNQSAARACTESGTPLARSSPLASVLLAIALFAMANPGSASDSFEALLVKAEQIRSTDIAGFRVLLGQLNGRIAEATPEQSQQLRYLKIYDLGYTGRYDLAVKDATALFDEVDDPDIKLRAGALIVNSYAATRNLYDGLRYLDLTLQLIDRVQDPELRSHGWFAASTLYSQAGQYELSQHYAEQILAISTNPRTRCFAGLQRVESLRQLRQLDEVDDTIESILQECERTQEKVISGFLWVIQARLASAKGDNAGAMVVLEQHLAEIEKTGYPRLVGEAQSLLGELHLEAGSLVEASRYANLALSRSSDLAFSLPLVNAHKTLYESTRRRGDLAAALKHHIAYADADRAYLDQIKTREIAYQAVRQETLQKTQTIELLNNQNRVLQLQQQVSAKTSQANQLLIVLLAVLLASIAYWAFKVKRMQVSFRKLAETDALTGISNRHHFNRRAAAVLEQCRKANEQVGLVMVDLDHFKSINDRFGHATGDWALKAVADACRQVCRRDDLLGRLGGEEFAFLLVGSDADACVSLADDCRQRIAAIDTLPSGHRFQITASFGVAGSRSCGHGFDALLAKADDALYLSKRDGRDRVSVQDATGEPQAALSG